VIVISIAPIPYSTQPTSPDRSDPYPQQRSIVIGSESVLCVINLDQWVRTAVQSQK
jgi:hypothetical protein